MCGEVSECGEEESLVKHHHHRLSAKVVKG